MDNDNLSIGNEINLFTHHLESLHFALPASTFFFENIGANFEKNFREFVENNCDVTDRNDDGFHYKVGLDSRKEYARKRFFRDNIKMASLLVPRSLFVSMISQYDAYLGRLLKFIFIAKPEILNASEKSYAYSEISKFGSIQDFQLYVVEKEVEKFLRKSHEDQIKYIEQQFSLTLTKNTELISKLVEITERRNLFVHADGKVSSYYLDVIKNHGLNSGGIKEGDSISLTQEYFTDSYECLYEIGVTLGQILWRKLFKDEAENSDKNLINVTFDLIERGSYSLACRLLSFAISTFKNIKSEYNELLMILNCAQAHKWSGNQKLCLEILETKDWSAKDELLKLGNFVLREDWENAKKSMKKLGNTDLMKFSYRDWPIFQNFRKEKIFLETYNEIFGFNFEYNSEDSKALTKQEDSHSNVA